MASSVIKRVLRYGDAKTYPVKGSTVVLHYTGYFKNGEVFDSSRERKQPYRVKVGLSQVIEGWDMGLLTMSLGEHAILIIPPRFAYGSSGLYPIIPPNETLYYDIHVLRVV